MCSEDGLQNQLAYPSPQGFRVLRALVHNVFLFSVAFMAHTHGKIDLPLNFKTIEQPHYLFFINILKVTLLPSRVSC